MASTTESLVSKVLEQKQHFVDSREWHADWSNRWIAFCDIVGFADRCNKSQDSVVNTIVRFHRCVTSATHIVPCKVFQFTDSAFAVADTPSELLRFCATLQHCCLAQNLIQLSKSHVLGHFLILVRTTLASGSILDGRGIDFTSQKAIGISPDVFLAGEGVVKAYKIEKGSAGSMVSLSEESHALIQKEKVEVRGNNSRPKSLLKRWVSEGFSKNMRHDGLVDFPWMLMRPEQPHVGLWVDSQAEIDIKLAGLTNIVVAMQQEFLAQHNPVQTAKHYAALLRHLIEVKQMCLNLENLRSWSMRDLQDSLGYGTHNTLPSGYDQLIKYIRTHSD